MLDWKKIKSDIGKGLKEGADAVKDGADFVGKKAGEVGAESQRRIKVFNTKRHIQDFMEELGAAVYSAEKAAPGTITIEAARSILEKIDLAHEELLELEKETRKDKD